MRGLQGLPIYRARRAGHKNIRYTPLSVRYTPLSVRYTPLSVRYTPLSVRYTPLREINFDAIQLLAGHILRVLVIRGGGGGGPNVGYLSLTIGATHLPKITSGLTMRPNPEQQTCPLYATKDVRYTPLNLGVIGFI